MQSGAKNYSSEDGDDFQHLPARSRTPVYIPHGMELALPSPANHNRTENLASPSNEFWNPSHDRYCLTSGTEVNITNNTTVLVVDVPVKPIEKLKRAVKKMQRVSASVFPLFRGCFRLFSFVFFFSFFSKVIVIIPEIARVRYLLYVYSRASITIMSSLRMSLRDPSRSSDKERKSYKKY